MAMVPYVAVITGLAVGLASSSALPETRTNFEVVRLPDRPMSPQTPEGMLLSPFVFELRKNGEPFSVKGVCYSPVEINQDINGRTFDYRSFRYLMTFGDLFWDPPAVRMFLPPLASLGLIIIVALFGAIYRYNRLVQRFDVDICEPLVVIHEKGSMKGAPIETRLLYCIVAVLATLALLSFGFHMPMFSGVVVGTSPGNPESNWASLWGDGPLAAEGTARADLAIISQTLNANAVRVYFMLSRAFETDITVDYMTDATASVLPAQSCTRLTHKAFLDEAHRNGIYVLIGIPMPIQFFHLENYNTTSQPFKDWWEFVLNETVADVGNHPATLGFTIMNELDDLPNAFPGEGLNPQPDVNSDFFHAATIKYARWVKAHAPGKLVGWAIHDVPAWPGFASRARPTQASEYLTTDSTYMEQIAAVFDYFGVNTYQSANFFSLLSAWGDKVEVGGAGKAYGAPSLSSAARPVLLTEVGWPATGRHKNGSGVSDPAGDLVDSEELQTNVADTMDKMLSQVFHEYKDISIGAFYFEYSDEWWKTPAVLAGNPQVASPHHHDGGNMCANDAFPNQCNDEESFGLFARKRSGERAVDSDNWEVARPTLPVDTLVARPPMVRTIARIFANVNATRP